MPGRPFCPKCGGVLRSPNHVCQPTKVRKHQSLIIPLKKKMAGMK